MAEEEEFRTIVEAAERLRVSSRSVRRWIESGKLPAYKPGGVWRIRHSDLEEFLERNSSPKAQAPPSSEPTFNDVLEEEERRTIYDALQSLAMRKVEDYGREVAAPDSPHFRDATAAALWIDGVQRDAAQWANWVIEEAATLAGPQAGDSLREHLLNALKVAGPLMAFDQVIRKGRRRLEDAVGQTDELTQRKLEKSTQHFEELREALSARAQ